MASQLAQTPSPSQPHAADLVVSEVVVAAARVPVHAPVLAVHVPVQVVVAENRENSSLSSYFYALIGIRHK